MSRRERANARSERELVWRGRGGEGYAVLLASFARQFAPKSHYYASALG